MVRITGRLVKWQNKAINQASLIIDRKPIDSDHLEKGKFYRIDFSDIPQDIIVHKKVEVNDNKTGRILLGPKIVGYLKLEFGKTYNIELTREDPVV